MRKFKIKNRRKRKYVKKNDLAHSFSHAQTLTIGVVPLAIMAIAFLTTTVMYSPALASIHLPNIRVSAPSITLPEISFNFSLPKISVELPALPEVKIAQPEMPKLSLPAMPRPEIPRLELPKIEMPKIVLPNPVPYIAAFGIFVIQSLGQFFQALSQGLLTIVTVIGESLVTAMTTIVQGIVQITAFFVQLFVQLVKAIWFSLTQTLLWSVNMIQATGSAIQQMTVQAITVLGAWTQATIEVSINAWNAFVWWIGTPFRAIGKATNEFLIFISPVTNYLSQSMQHASEDLSMGGNALVQGADYVSHSMEENSVKNK